MSKQPLLVGIMPSGPCDIPLDGMIGMRLCYWAGLIYQLGNGHRGIQDYFDTINLNRYPSRKLDEALAFQTAEQIRIRSRGQPHVLCGREVAAFFGMGDSPFWGWLCNYVVIPHPSGRCRIYNDPAARSRTGAILKEALASGRRPSGAQDHRRPARRTL